MKKIFENAVWWSGVIMVGLILGVSLQFVRAWTEPIAAPPGSNVGAPINTGIIEQLKQGALGINGLLKLYAGLQLTTGAGVGKIITSDATGNATWVAGIPVYMQEGGAGAGLLSVIQTYKTTVCGTNGGAGPPYSCWVVSCYASCDGSCPVYEDAANCNPGGMRCTNTSPVSCPNGRLVGRLVPL